MRFNGESRDYLTELQNQKRSAWAPITRNILTVPGRPGGYYQYTETSIRTIDVPVLIKGNDYSDLQKLKEDLAAWLITDEPTELIFDDEPDRVYFAMVDGSLDLDEIIKHGMGTITFICPDPYKYGPLREGVFETDIATITNSGTEETYPTFRATVKESITVLDIVTDDAYMRIGKPVDVNSFAAEREKLLLHDAMNNLTGWGTVSSGIIDGTISGQMLADAYRFYANNYGTGTAWHGPALAKAVSQVPLQDFRIEAIVELLNTNVLNNGRIEIYLVDDQLKVVGKMALKNVDRGSNRNYGEIRLGDSTVNHHLIDEYGGTESTWANFYGMLRISRVGQKWEAYITQINKNTGTHYARKFVAFEDFDLQFNRKLSSVVVHLGQFGTNSVTTNRIHDLKVYQINTLTDNQIPYIAHAGDIIEFNHAKSLITINGEDRKDLKDFGARPFPLKKGVNNVQISPFSSLSKMEVEWRLRYK